MLRFLLAILLFIGLLSSCLKSLYFVADPYWETVTGVSFTAVRLMSLRAGRWAHIVKTTEDTTWRNIPEQNQGQNERQNAGQKQQILPLKMRVETWLDEGRKIIMSPYWLREIEREPLKFTRGQLLLIDAVASDPKIQSVISNWEQGYYKMGQIASAFMQKHPERRQTIAIFYRGRSYDKYYEAFASGFKFGNDLAVQNRLVSQRYYAAEVADSNSFLEQLDASQNLVILGMAHLSNKIYRTISVEENSLFMVENFAASRDSTGQILLSLDSDYSALVRAAIRQEPLNLESPPLPEANKMDGRISKRPYILNLPNPELLSDIVPAEELARQKIREQRPSRLAEYLARVGNNIGDFLVNFPDTTALPWFN